MTICLDRQNRNVMPQIIIRMFIHALIKYKYNIIKEYNQVLRCNVVYFINFNFIFFLQNVFFLFFKCSVKHLDPRQDT